MDIVANIPLLLFFIANSCYALAYTARNMLVLRLLTVTAALLTFPYFIFRSEILYSALFWQSTFALINIVNIIRLVHERRPLKLTDNQRLLKDLVFRHFTDHEMLRLLKHATSHRASRGQLLIESDSSIDSLYLLCSGSVDVIKNGRFLSRRRPGAFLGEVHYLTGEQTTADVIFAEDGTYLRWDVSELRSMLEKNPALCKAFDSMLTIDVARKLRRNNRQKDAKHPVRRYAKTALSTGRTANSRAGTILVKCG